MPGAAPPEPDMTATAGVTKRISAGRARIASTIIVTPTRTSRTPLPSLPENRSAPASRNAVA